MSVRIEVTRLEDLTPERKRTLALLLSRAFTDARHLSSEPACAARLAEAIRRAHDPDPARREPMPPEWMKRFPTWREMQKERPFGVEGTHFIAWAGNRALAHLALYERSGTLDGRPVRLAGIEDVASDPEARGRGLPTRLLQLAAEHARLEGFHLGVLWTHYPDFYARLGWRPWQGPAPGSKRPPMALAIAEELRRMGDALFWRELRVDD